MSISNQSSDDIVLKSREEILIGALSTLSPADIIKSKVIGYFSVLAFYLPTSA
jgi:hypothetical protein